MSGVPRCTIDAIRSIRAVDFALSILIRSYDIYCQERISFTFVYRNEFVYYVEHIMKCPIEIKRCNESTHKTIEQTQTPDEKFI